ncbi:MAG: hypothetical protein JXB14_04335 [Candidatus Altiarchaeota archaeon]|nr:hypothetical protein [Candidatus Altiarchaeota archaeon]
MKKITLYTGLAIVAMAMAAVALEQSDYFDLTDYPEYCYSNLVSEYCTPEGFTDLVALSKTDPERYINQLVYPDYYAYTGNVYIETADINVVVSGGRAEVVARYRLVNSEEEPQRLKIMILNNIPNMAVYEDGAIVDLDEHAAWTTIFNSNQEKEITIEYTEELTEKIFGYNTNLVFDNQFPAMQLAASGTYKFTLPGTPSRCTQGAQINGNVVIWTRKSFIPWTNPLTDLICVWDGGQPVVGPGPEPAPGGVDNTVWIALVVVLVLIGGIYYYKNYHSKKAEKPAEKKSSLEMTPGEKSKRKT